MPPCAPPWSARTPDSAHSPSLLAPPWAPAAPEWEEKEKCQDPAAAQRPRSPQRAEGPPLLLQEGDSRPTQASLSPGPPSLQARVFCHPDPWSPAGKPQPRLSPTSVLGLAREQSRAPSLSASLYKCASCRAPLGISTHDWPAWLSGWVGRRLTVGPTAPGGPRSPLLPLAPAVPWKPYEGGRLGLVAAPQGWPLPPSAPTLDQDQAPQLVPSLAPAEPHTHPAGPAFLTYPGQPRPTLTTGTGSIGIHPSCPGVTAGRVSQGWPLAGGAAWSPWHPVRLSPGDPGRV